MRSYPWMRWLPWLKNRRCSDCGREYARWFGVVALRHETARAMTFLWVGVWLVLGAVAIGLGAAWLVAWRYAQAG